MSSKMYVDFHVLAYNTNGDVIQRDIVEDTGAVDIEDIFNNAVLNSLDRIRIEPIEVRMKNEDGEITGTIERTDVENPLVDI